MTDDQPQDRHVGDAPIEAAYREKMTRVAHAIDSFFNEGLRNGDRTTGFVLLVFPFNSDSGRCNYISNGADRNDIVKLLTEQLKHFQELGHG